MIEAIRELTPSGRRINEAERKRRRFEHEDQRLQEACRPNCDLFTETFRVLNAKFGKDCVFGELTTFKGKFISPKLSTYIDQWMFKESEQALVSIVRNGLTDFSIENVPFYNIGEIERFIIREEVNRYEGTVRFYLDHYLLSDKDHRIREKIIQCHSVAEGESIVEGELRRLIHIIPSWRPVIFSKLAQDVHPGY